MGCKALVYRSIVKQDDFCWLQFAGYAVKVTAVKGKRMTLDKFDQAILSELRKNARASLSHIADCVSLSRSSVTDRIKKLEANGVIKGYQVILSESQKEGVTVFFEIQHNRARCAEVIHVFQSIPEVVSCNGISGDMDLLVQVKAESMRRIHEIREKLDCQPDVAKIKTHVVLSEWI